MAPGTAVTHPIWPLFDVRVRTPRLELAAVDDDLALTLARLGATGIHPPETMPFLVEWTDVPSPQQERNTLQFHWRNRAELGPERWTISFGVVVEGQVVGSTGLTATGFRSGRTFETGSWLALPHQGRGIGKEMRIATLQLGFVGFGADRATTSAYEDNAASLGVTRSLRYTPTGRTEGSRRGEPADLLHFEMTRDEFMTRHHRDDIELSGVESCLPLLGLP